MRAAIPLLYGAKARAFDLLHRRQIVPPRAATAFALSLLLRRVSPRASFRLLCRTHRILLLDAAPRRLGDRLRELVERSLRRACRPNGVLESLVRDDAPPNDFDRRTARGAGIVLKTPLPHGGAGIRERGVLLLKNTERLDCFRRCVSMPALLREYTLVLEPSWSGYANPLLLAFCTLRDHPIVVMAPHEGDSAFLDRLGSNLRPIPAGASDWVDPTLFRPLEGCTKRFDAVVVSRWALFKRHHLLFRALRRIGDPSLRVALVGGGIPGVDDGASIKAMIRAQRLTRQIEIFEYLPPEGVNEILNRSKVNLLLSRQEGSNRSLFEGFFAGVPGLAFSNHVGLPRDHFVPQTGRLIAEHELAEALLYFRERWTDFDPRPWALEHIAPEVTTAKLNRALKALAAERGEPWTTDIVAKCNCPELSYYPRGGLADGLPTMDDLLRRFPASPAGT